MNFREYLIFFRVLSGFVIASLAFICLDGFLTVSAMPMNDIKKIKNTASSFIARELAKGKKANALLDEKSPYLLQHAFNPVNWYAWGEEAFKAAKRENKPIFLSIGYSTCHWCHVMAHESFENLEIAEILNRFFICIKVDREERPDIDQVYMEVTQSMTGSGGWPMSVFLTPDLKPFFAGTYFPPLSKYGKPGFLQLLNSINQAWHSDKQKISKYSQEILEGLAENNMSAGLNGLISESDLKGAAQQFMIIYDEKNGGFGNAPKFPRPSVLNFLMRYSERYKDQEVREAVYATLRKMANGGIYDHIGGGFHRYSVDGQWRIPHFEKMLYDQAMIVPAYVEAYQLSGDSFFKEIALETLDYVLRELHDPQGAFYSAEDADSPQPDDIDKQREGAYYVWGQAEIRNLFEAESAEIIENFYNIRPEGNALEDPHGYFSKKNILYKLHSAESAAGKNEISEERLGNILKDARRKMLDARNKRPRPHLDDKILTSWNGLAVSALAKGYAISGDMKYLEGAKQSVKFIKEKLYSSTNKTLMHRYRDGDADIEGLLDDYAFFIQGLLDLYEVSFNLDLLSFAYDLSRKQIEFFHDKTNGGFFETSGLDKSVMLRLKGNYDGAEPSGNSISALNMLRIGHMLDEEEFINIGRNTIKAFGGQVGRSPLALPHLLVAHDFNQKKPAQIIIAGHQGAKDTLAMLNVLSKKFIPNKVVLLAVKTTLPINLSEYLSHLNSMPMRDEKATAYVCENFSCLAPTNDLNIFKELLVK